MTSHQRTPQELKDSLVNRLKYLGSIQPGKSTLDFDTLLQMDESDGVSPQEPLTDTVAKQLEVETGIQEIYDEILSEGSDKFPVLHSVNHLKYTNMFLHRPLPGGFSKLDASHSWIIFWLMNATLILGGELDAETKREAAIALESYIVDDGTFQGIGGGYEQLPHLASTYAAVMSMALIGDEDLWAKLDRTKMLAWLKSLKSPDGSFSMHLDGETDCRAAYCALCVASVLGILDDELTENVADWLARCQTFEGGFGGVPGDEAHGGYAFCALAALCILLPPDAIRNCIDVDSLMRWTAARQYAIEGGLSGRTNKLVDGCYSHWVGGLSALLEAVSGQRQVIQRMPLQNYILCCCQNDPMGLVDKPGCSPDFYHTNYVLCGLSMCQNYQTYHPAASSTEGFAYGYLPTRIDDPEVTDNKDVNILLPLDPIFGTPHGYVEKMHAFYKTIM